MTMRLACDGRTAELLQGKRKQPATASGVAERMAAPKKKQGRGFVSNRIGGFIGHATSNPSSLSGSYSRLKIFGSGPSI